MKLYALHDRKAKAFSNFHVERSDAVAARGFAEAVNQQGSIFGKFPEDFELVSLCDVHDCYDAAELRDAVVVGEPASVVVLTAAAVVAMRIPQDKQLSLLKEA